MYLAGVGRVGEEGYTERYTRATKGASVDLEPARYLKDSPIVIAGLPFFGFLGALFSPGQGQVGGVGLGFGWG